jgi:hypothetical protein
MRARLQACRHDLTITCFYACSDAVSVLVWVGGSLQTVVKMFTDVLWTFARRESCWRSDQQCGQYRDAKHTWHLTRRYRHFSLPQSFSASRFTAGASGFFILSPIGRAAGAARNVGILTVLGARGMLHTYNAARNCALSLSVEATNLLSPAP